MEELTRISKRPIGRRGFLKGAGGIAAFGGIFTIVGCGDDDVKTTATAKPAGTTAGGATLYTRLGGAPAVTKVVDDFFVNVAADTRINGFFAKTDLPKLKKLVVEQLGMATGGPEKYTGRDMKTTHAGLKITMTDFNVFVEDLVKALDANKVPEKEKNELLAALGPMNKDIVTA